MPVGPFKDFATCVAAQRRDGKSKDSANRICGEIEKRSNQSITDWRTIEFLAPIKEGFGDDDGFVIKGIAINETTTRNGITYVADELNAGASSLKNKPILKDHTNSVDNIVGRTTENVFFNAQEKNIVFEGKIMDEDIQEKIKDGRIQSVSIGATVQDLEHTEASEETPEKIIARGIDFVELSLVAVPADPNAGFAKAMYESFQLKENNIQDKESEEISIQDKTEENKMDDNILKELQSQMASITKELSAQKAEKEAKKTADEVKKKEEEFQSKVVNATIEEVKKLIVKEQDEDSSEDSEEDSTEKETSEEKVKIKVKEQDEGSDEDKTSGEVDDDVSEEKLDISENVKIVQDDDTMGVFGVQVNTERYKKLNKLNHKADYNWELK